MERRPILKAVHVDKSFGGTRALKDARFELYPGEVHGLVGENGAGKSTLIKILSGALRPDRAQIFFQGEEVEISSPRMAAEMGIATVYQEPLLYPELTVVENIFMGREIRGRMGAIDYAAQRKKAQELFQAVGIDPDFLDRRVSELTIGQAQLVLIARALAYDAKVMIFDEPTAILTQHEAARLFEIIQRLKAQGVGIIYISHRLQEIFQLTDRVTVMRDGEVRGTFDTAGITEDRIIELMAGRSLHRQERRAKQLDHAPKVLEVEGWSAPPAFQDVSFALRQGEILGFFGLVGSGRSEVMQAITGIIPVASGRLLLYGKPVKIRSPREAMEQGIVYVPEDRKTQGLFQTLSVRYNIGVAVLKALKRWGFVVDTRGEERLGQQAVSDLAIKLAGLSAEARSLSGGNQQKVLLARWLATQPRILILDEPTRGVDVGAKEEIHRRILQLADSGVSVIVVSSELPEVLKLSDRIITMQEGRITGEFRADEATEEAVLGAAIRRTPGPAGNQGRGEEGMPA